MSIHRTVRLGFLLAAALLARPAAAAVDPSVKCQLSRLKATAKYASCLLLTDAKALQAGIAADHTACDGKLQTKWASIDAKYGAECPPTNEVTLVEDVLSTCTADALVPPASYEVVFAVTNPVTMGTLQFTVDYASSDGEFAGSGVLVSCTNLLGGAIFTANDTDVAQSLAIGVLNMSPAATPADLVKCVFDRGLYGLPEAGDFTITVDSATDGDGNPIAPDVEIISFTPVP